MLNFTSDPIFVLNPKTQETQTFEPCGVVATVRVGGVVDGYHPATGVEIVREVKTIKHLPTLEKAKKAGGVLVTADVLNHLDKDWVGVAFTPLSSLDDKPVLDTLGQVIAVTRLATVPHLTD